MKLLLILLTTAATHAAPITGTFMFGGMFVPDTLNLSDASGITAAFSSLVYSDGSMTPGSSGEWSGPITFEYSPNSFQADWFRFELRTFNAVVVGETFVNGSGTGMIYFPNHEPTLATLGVTGARNPNNHGPGSLTFSITASPVPESLTAGYSLALLIPLILRRARS